MKARMQNPAVVLPGVMKPILAVLDAAKQGGVPESTLELVHLRASQINGCSFCVDLGTLPQALQEQGRPQRQEVGRDR